jgi:hypothetical protein
MTMRNGSDPIRARRAILLAALAALLVFSAPVSGSAKRGQGGGVVPSASLRCSKGQLVRFEFDFAGRLPAGDKYVQVMNGSGVATNFFCEATTSTRLTGQSGLGTHQWDCFGYWHGLQPGAVVDAGGLTTLKVGATLLHDARCTTVGKKGGFALKIVFHVVSGGETSDGVDSGMRGAFHVVS